MIPPYLSQNEQLQVWNTSSGMNTDEFERKLCQLEDKQAQIRYLPQMVQSKCGDDNVQYGNGQNI